MVRKECKRCGWHTNVVVNGKKCCYRCGSDWPVEKKHKRERWEDDEVTGLFNTMEVSHAD